MKKLSRQQTARINKNAEKIPEELRKFDVT